MEIMDYEGILYVNTVSFVLLISCFIYETQLPLSSPLIFHLTSNTV